MKIMDGALLASLFHMIEEDKENKKLINLLLTTIKSYNIEKEVIYIEFRNDISIKIETDINSYKLLISDSTFYFDSDNENSNMGFDRILFYLKQISEYKYGIQNDKKGI